MSALSGRATLWLARVGAVGLGIIVVLTFCDVTGRYLFNAPIVGTVEMTELLMGAMIYFGVGFTTHMRGHIRVDIVFDMLPPRIQALCDVLTHVVAVALVALMCWRLWVKAGVTFEKNDLTQIWELPVWPVAYLMAAASILMLTALLLRFGQSLALLVRGGEPA